MTFDKKSSYPVWFRQAKESWLKQFFRVWGVVIFRRIVDRTKRIWILVY